MRQRAEQWVPPVPSARGRWVNETQQSPVQETKLMGDSETSTRENAEENAKIKHPISPSAAGSHTSKCQELRNMKLGILPCDISLVVQW